MSTFKPHKFSGTLDRIRFWLDQFREEILDVYGKQFQFELDTFVDDADPRVVVRWIDRRSQGSHVNEIPLTEMNHVEIGEIIKQDFVPIIRTEEFLGNFQKEKYLGSEERFFLYPTVQK